MRTLRLFGRMLPILLWVAALLAFPFVCSGFYLEVLAGGSFLGFIAGLLKTEKQPSPTTRGWFVYRMLVSLLTGLSVLIMALIASALWILVKFPLVGIWVFPFALVGVVFWVQNQWMAGMGASERVSLCLLLASLTLLMADPGWASLLVALLVLPLVAKHQPENLRELARWFIHRPTSRNVVGFSSVDETKAKLEGIPLPMRKLLTPDEGLDELYSTLQGAGDRANEFVIPYFEVGYHLFSAWDLSDPRAYSKRYFRYWADEVSNLSREELHRHLNKLRRIDGRDSIGGDHELARCYWALVEDPDEEVVEDDLFEALEQEALEFDLSELVAAQVLGIEICDRRSLVRWLERKKPAGVLAICRRILAHAVRFQEGPFIRELVQNGLDEANRIGADGEAREMLLRCSRNSGGQLVVSVEDHLGMSESTVLQYLLVPNQTTKSFTDSIGRFGQGFFTTLSGCETVVVETVTAGTEEEFHSIALSLTPRQPMPEHLDVRVRLKISAHDAGPQGTKVVWTARPVGSMRDVLEMKSLILRQLRAVPVEEMLIHLNGEVIQNRLRSLAKIPTRWGAFSLWASCVFRRKRPPIPT